MLPPDYEPPRGHRGQGLDRRLALPLILLTFASMLACRAASRLGGELFPPPSTPASRATATAISTPSPAPPESLASSTPAPTPSATIPPAPELSPTAAVQTPPAWQIEVFEELWSAVNEEYLYDDFNGVDWDAIREEYLARILAGMDPQEFYFAMDEMLFRLGDDHSFFLNPTEVVQEESELAGEMEYVGVGILITSEPERGRAIVLLTFPNSPAERAGLKSRDLILEIDGVPVSGREPNLGQWIRGPAGSEVVLKMQSPGEEPREVRIVREQIFGPIQVPFQVLESPDGQRVGYVMIPTFADSTISGQVEDAIESMGGTAPLQGLIVDNRWNNGGVDTMLRGTLSLFVQGLVGYFVNNNGDRGLTIEPNDISGSQELDLVVLIGPDTISFGEIFAGILSDLGRAHLIGELTGGNVETLWGYDFSDGSRAWIAHDSFRPLNHPDADWESTGVVPDEAVLAAWEEFRLEDDPVIRAALDYFDRE